MSFNFKLDPSSLPKLSSRGDNFTEWRSAWTIALKYAGLWPVVSGKLPRPTDTTEAAIWDEGDNKALVMILLSVHSDLTMTVATADTSPRAWNVLAERFDRDTGHLAIHLFRALTNTMQKKMKLRLAAFYLNGIFNIHGLALRGAIQYWNNTGESVNGFCADLSYTKDTKWILVC